MTERDSGYENVISLTGVPVQYADEEAFRCAFERAALSQLTHEEYVTYQLSLKPYRDMRNVIDTAFDEGYALGVEQGIAIGMNQALAKLMEKGFSEEEARQMLE